MIGLQKSQTTCWQHVARSAGLDVDKGMELVSLSPERKLTAEERLAMNFRSVLVYHSRSSMSFSKIIFSSTSSSSSSSRISGAWHFSLAGQVHACRLCDFMKKEEEEARTRRRRRRTRRRRRRRRS